MRVISDPSEIEYCLNLRAGVVDEQKCSEINLEWARNYGWKVVPVEDTAHFASDEIGVLVPVLLDTGCTKCFAIATEPIDPAPVCYEISISGDGFRSFNRECGLFRYLLIDASRSWAVSCNEWYNLWTAPPRLLTAMLGKPIEEAREEFLDYAILLAREHSSDKSLLQVATYYESL